MSRFRLAVLSRYFDQAFGAERDSAAVAQPDPSSLVFNGRNVDNDMKACEPPDEHAALNLADVRERCAVKRNHSVLPCGPTDRLPPAGGAARAGTRAQGRSEAEPH